MSSAEKNTPNGEATSAPTIAIIIITASSTHGVLHAVESAFQVAKPIILNFDQGSQFTSHDYIEFIEENRVKISMDGKSRWADNIMIERWFRTLKYDEVYLKDYSNIKDARQQIGEFIHKYNFERLHSALGYQTPAENYYPILLMQVA